MTEEVVQVTFSSLTCKIQIGRDTSLFRKQIFACEPFDLRVCALNSTALFLGMVAVIGLVPKLLIHKCLILSLSLH